MKYGLLGDHAEILSGFAFKSENFNTDGQGIPLVRIRDVVAGETSTFYNGAFEERFVVQPGDTLIGMDGDFNRALWKSAPALLNQRVCKITARGDLDQRYLYHLLPGLLQVISDRTPFVTVKHLSAKDLKETEIPLPPLVEQKRIAAILDQADALRRLRWRALDRLNTLGQAVFHKMFGNPQINDRSWPVVPLSQLGILERGVSKHRPRNDPKLLGGRHPLIQTGDVARAADYITSHSSTYSEAGLQQSRKWRQGTLCITIAANIADTALLDFDACFPDSVVGFDSGDEAVNFFVHRWFATVKNHLEAVAPAVAQKNINLAILRELPVIKPDGLLIQSFFRREHEIKASKSLAQSALAQAEQLFTSLQHRAFRGEL